MMCRDLKCFRPSSTSGFTTVALVVIAKLSNEVVSGSNSAMNFRQCDSSSGSPPPAISRTIVGISTDTSPHACSRTQCRSRDEF